MITNAEIEKTIGEYLVTKAGVAPELIADPQRKLAEFGLDSLSVIEMLFEVEDKYGVHVDDPMTLKEFDLAQLYALIGSLIEEKRNAPTPAPAAIQPVPQVTVSGGANA